MPEEQSIGGNLNDAVRVGGTVRRRAGPWTPAVHALLRFLEREGFDAPRVIGMDERGREILEYIEGEAPTRRIPGYRSSLARLRSPISTSAHDDCASSVRHTGYQIGAVSSPRCARG